MLEVAEVHPALEVVLDQEKVIVEALKSFTTKEEINALEAELLSCDFNQPISVSHAFSKGIYARTVVLPKGMLAIGHEHTSECLNIVVSGSVSVVIDGQVRVVSAPATFVSPPGARKIGYIHEDLTWITIHRVDTDEVSRLEEELIVKTPAFRKYEESTSLAAAKVDEFFEDRIDYLKFVNERGLNEELVKQIVTSTDDRCDYPCDLVELKTSPIQGNGMFAKFDFEPNSQIGVAAIQGKRTKLGRYCNHAKYPNAEMVADNAGNINLIAIGSISSGNEITVNYRDSVSAAKASLGVLNSLKI